MAVRASLVSLCENTVRKYIKEYEEGGIEKLKEINFYRPKSELLEYNAYMVNIMKIFPILKMLSLLPSLKLI